MDSWATLHMQKNSAHLGPPLSVERTYSVYVPKLGTEGDPPTEGGGGAAADRSRSTRTRRTAAPDEQGTPEAPPPPRRAAPPGPGTAGSSRGT